MCSIRSIHAEGKTREVEEVEPKEDRKRLKEKEKCVKPYPPSIGIHYSCGFSKTACMLKTSSLFPYF